MNCQTTTELLSDYYDGGLSAEERRSLEEHLKDCASCSTEFKHLSQSLKVLHDTKPLQTTHVFVAGVTAAAKEHLERKAGLLQDTESVTVQTPRADLPSPERRPAPAWVPYALAATLVAAFLLGWRGGGSGRQKEIDDAVARAVKNLPSRPAPDPVVITERVDERKVLEKNGLVLSGGEWIPRRFDEAFKAGKVCIGGQMLEKEEAVKALGVEPPPVKPPDPVVAAKVPSADEILDRHGYTKVNDVPVPKAWVEKWSEGYIQTGVNEWKKASDFKEEFVREHNLVDYRGKLMTREQKEAIEAQQLVKAPEAALAANEVTRALDGLQIGPPMNFHGITIYPLLSGAAPGEAAFTTLHGALGAGKLELGDTGSLFTAQFKNGGEADVLLLAGEILAGGRCARVIAEDTFVRARKTESVAVFCVEPGAWRPAADRFVKESGHYLAPPSIRRALVWQNGQGALWSMLARRLGKSQAAGQADLFRRHAEAIVEIRSEFARLLEREAGAVGLAVALGESLEFAELFQSPALFRLTFDRIVAGAALEALEREADPALRPAAAPVPNSVRGVKQFLEGAFSWTYEPRDGGYAVRRDSAWVGRATATGGALHHAVLFAVGPPAWERRPGIDLPKDKMARAVQEYETRLKSRTAGPSRKISEVQDLASIGGPEVTVALLRHLNETDTGVRSAVIQELGAARDRRATEPLVQLMTKNRQDLPVFSEAVRALGRLGDEASVEPLLKQIDAGDAGVSKVVILGLPELLLQVKTRAVLEKATQRLVVIYESAESAARGEGLGVDPVTKDLRGAEAAVLRDSCRTALNQITEIDFSSAVRCRQWWNDRDQREKYLRERTGKP